MLLLLFFFNRVDKSKVFLVKLRGQAAAAVVFAVILNATLDVAVDGSSLLLGIVENDSAPTYLAYLVYSLNRPVLFMVLYRGSAFFLPL